MPYDVHASAPECIEGLTRQRLSSGHYNDETTCDRVCRIYHTDVPATSVAIPARRWRRPPQTAPGECVYAIGDIHGCYDLLSELLELIAEDVARFRTGRRIRLLLLGDVIDRGPDSRKLLHALMLSQQQNGELMEVLLGNHEAALLDSVAGVDAAQRTWLAFGGDATLHSFGIEPPSEEAFGAPFARRLYDHIGPDLLDWIEQRPTFQQSGDFFFCHAGVRPRVPLARQGRDDLLWIREPFLSNRTYHGAVVVHGHTIVPTPQILRNRIGIDTGAYRTGVLTALCVDGQEAAIIATERGRTA